MNTQAIADFFTKTWYIWVALAIIFALWFYNSRLSSSTKYRLSKTFTKKVLFMVALVVGWIVWSKYGQINSVKDAHRWMPVIILLYFLAINYFGKLRYETQQLLTPNFHGSFSKNPYNINGFIIFAIDSFNAGGISWDYAQRIVVLREETVELFLHGALSIAEVGKVSRYDLDPDVKDFIENNKFLKGAKEEIYYGWFDSLSEIDYKFSQLKSLAEEKGNKDHIYNLLKAELGVTNPKVSSLLWSYRNLCKSTNKQTEVLDSTVESVEKGVEHHKRVKDAYVDRREKQQNYSGNEEDY